MLVRHNKNLYNTTYYIDRLGKVKGTYRKVNLWHDERAFVAPGSEVSVFNTRFGKIGLSICWDLALPTLYRAMARKGAKIVFCPSFWGNQKNPAFSAKENREADERFVKACVAARAFENNAVMVFCNAAGVSKEKNYEVTLTGHSQIAVPIKGTLKRCEHNKETMVIQEVDLSILTEAEKHYKVRKDLKTKVF